VASIRDYAQRYIGYRLDYMPRLRQGFGGVTPERDE